MDTNELREMTKTVRSDIVTMIHSVCSTITFLICEGLHPLSGCPL